jgi:ABC-type cobalamin/Fe3+-siderophores transport system ATPase subunit
MNTLLLDSLEIENFRIFHKLRIEQLGHANLIVGHNSVGKTCLLEALWLYAHRGDPAVIWEILGRRGEVANSAGIGAAVAERTLGIKHLFYGRPQVEDLPDPIHIGPIDDPEKGLSVGVCWFTTHGTEEGTCMVEPLAPKDVPNAHNPTLRLQVQVDSEHTTSYLFSADLFRNKPRLVPKSIPCVFIPAECMSRNQMGNLWDSVTAAGLQADVLEALHIIVPEIEQLTIPSDFENRVRPGGRPLERIPHVKLAGNDTSLPTCSLGEGLNRVLGIATSLANARDGLLLVDDIGSTLHYAAQVDLWRWLFDMARRLNVQVFATTHSWDCIEAFQHVASENTTDEQAGAGVLVRLDRQPEQPQQIMAESFAEEALTEVTREQVEVR